MKYFTVIDLKHAFFTIPLAEECRYQFAFTYGGVKLQYKVLPQGHRNSPGIFNKVLKDCLSPIEVLSGAVIVQYMDDVLIGARSAKDCLDVTAAVLSRLLECGFKVSKTKLQCCRSQVSFSQSQARIRPDLSDQPLPDSRLLFTDGHCHRLPDGSLSAGAAVVELSPPDHTRTVASWGPCGGSSAQLAELMALKLALEVASGQRVTIYTDSAYVCGLVLRDLSSWKRNGFLTAKGTPIVHKELCEEVADCLLLPAAVAVVKVSGHSKSGTMTAIGNRAADVAAKVAGSYHFDSPIDGDCEALIMDPYFWGTLGVT
uniref:ribonuclease H n=1 Tax=Neogobius melanostomus TaxID=47308 RepID=A0A8C6UH15_9GOBI